MEGFERMEGAENRPLVVAEDLKRIGGTPRARAPAARPIRFGRVVTTGPLKSAKTIRSSMSATTAGAAPGTPRRGPIRFDRSVTTGPLKRAKTIRLSGPATSIGEGC